MYKCYSNVGIDFIMLRGGSTLAPMSLPWLRPLVLRQHNTEVKGEEFATVHK